MYKFINMYTIFSVLYSINISKLLPLKLSSASGDTLKAPPLRIIRDSNSICGCASARRPASGYDSSFATPAQPVMPTSMPTAPVTGLEMGADATSMNQTTPGGFNAANIPGVGNGELDSILNGGVPAAAPTNPASNMSLDDVLTGIM